MSSSGPRIRVYDLCFQRRVWCGKRWDRTSSRRRGNSPGEPLHTWTNSARNIHGLSATLRSSAPLIWICNTQPKLIYRRNRLRQLLTAGGLASSESLFGPRVVLPIVPNLRRNHRCKGIHGVQAALSLRGLIFYSGSRTLPDRKQYLTNPFADSIFNSASAGQKLCVATEVRLSVSCQISHFPLESS